MRKIEGGGTGGGGDSRFNLEEDEDFETYSEEALVKDLTIIQVS